MVRLISTALIVAMIAGVSAPALAGKKHEAKGGGKGDKSSTASDLGLAIGASLLKGLGKKK